jgi:hypothetical protein
MDRFALPLLALALGTCGLLIAFLRAKSRASGTKRPFWDYLLIWPLILDGPERKDRPARGGPLLTNCEIAGWLAVLLLIALAVAFDW